MSIFAPSTAKAHHSLVPHWVWHLGPVGLFLISIVDASVFPLPIPGTTDLLLLLFVINRGNPFLLAASAIFGSLIGGYTTWHLGKKGGEAALRRWVRKSRRARISHWMQRHPVLAVFLPAILPPPIPLSPFLLAAGALGVSRLRFLTVFTAARTLRYSLIAWLAATYGRTVVRMYLRTQHTWSAPLLWAFGALVLAGIAYGVWRYRSRRASKSNDDAVPEPAAARGN